MSDDMHEWSGAYALDALDDLERQRFERHLATCADCAGDVLAFREVAAELPAAAVPAGPALRSRVLTAISATPQVATSAGSPPRRSWRTTLVTVAAAFALLATAGAVTLTVAADRRADVAQAGLDRISAVMAAPNVVVSGETTQGTTVSVVSSSTGSVIFPGPLPSLPQDRAYQYWWIVDGVAASLSVGAAGGATEPVFVEAGLAGGTVGITAEPAEGSGQPTSDPLVVVELPPA